MYCFDILCMILLSWFFYGFCCLGELCGLWVIFLILLYIKYWYWIFDNILNLGLIFGGIKLLFVIYDSNDIGIIIIYF